MDVFAPLDLVPGKSLDSRQGQLIANAAGCWNLEFGTKMTATWNPTAAQQVRIELNPMACMNARAGVTVAAPDLEVNVCVGNASDVPFFHVVLHELGHVLNIWYHVNERYSVMHAETGMGRAENFSDADRRAFQQANGAPRPALCRQVKIINSDLRCVCLP